MGAARPSASATSSTTSPDRFWRPAGSDPDYTLDHEEAGFQAKPAPKKRSVLNTYPTPIQTTGKSQPEQHPKR